MRLSAAKLNHRKPVQDVAFHSGFEFPDARWNGQERFSFCGPASGGVDYLTFRSAGRAARREQAGECAE